MHAGTAVRDPAIRWPPAGERRLLLGAPLSLLEESPALVEAVIAVLEAASVLRREASALVREAPATAQRTLAPADLAAPAQFRLQRGTLTGQLIVRASRVLKAAAYEVQTATADPTVESNWNDAGTYTTCRRIQLDGLTPGKVYAVRMRAFGAAGAGAWTSPPSLMVV